MSPDTAAAPTTFGAQAVRAPRTGGGRPFAEPGRLAGALASPAAHVPAPELLRSVEFPCACVHRCSYTGQFGGHSIFFLGITTPVFFIV